MTNVAFEPTDLAQLADPYPAFAELRRVAPIVRLRSGFRAVTGYAAAMDVFRERACASGPIAQRYTTPPLFVARVPVAPVTIAGVAVGAYEPLLVFLAAANRDPATYAEPDAFRPGRDEPPALSFAYGAHYCLGAALARAEAEIMLETLARRWPDLALRGDRPLRWHQRGPLRGLDELVVTRGGAR